MRSERRERNVNEPQGAGAKATGIDLPTRACVPIYRKSFFERLNSLGQFDYAVVHAWRHAAPTTFSPPSILIFSISQLEIKSCPFFWSFNNLAADRLAGSQGRF